VAVAADTLQRAGFRQAVPADVKGADKPCFTASRFRNYPQQRLIVIPGGTMSKRQAIIRNIAEVPWRQFPNHFGGALSKPLVMPETAGSQHLDYRISMYQPMAHVERHKHEIQEQIYHVIEGEGLMEIDGRNHVVRKHDFIFLPPGVEHSISNTGLVDLVFLVVTSPVTDGDRSI
jgi:mannose-6-phosphate isomerase-like protein (cupin superfamily)